MSARLRFIQLSIAVIGIQSALAINPEQIHLALGETVLEISVTWSTHKPTKGSLVQLKEGDEWKTMANGTSTYFDPDHNNPQYIHKALLTGLKPETTYEYRCGSPDTWSKVFTFKTGSLNANWTPRVAIFGDMGYEYHKCVNELTKRVKDRLYDAIVNIGDIGYLWEEDKGTLGDKYMNLVEPIAGNTPFMVCPGNHDEYLNFTHFKERFYMPNQESQNYYYSFDMGPIHFVAFSTEVYYEPKQLNVESIVAQFNWLKEDLRKANQNRKDRPWIIVYGHRPMYCSTENNGDWCNVEGGGRYRKSNADPVFKDYVLEQLFFDAQVDLQFYGHEHNYERLWPIMDYKVMNGSVDEPYRNAKAPVHVITGAAGNKHDKEDFKKEKPAWSAKRISDFGFTSLQAFNATHLYFEQIVTDDDKETEAMVVDKVWLIKD